jgi:hypothetical protein
MLLIHETHTLVGGKEEEFEFSVREGWARALEKGDDARLLWYLTHAHGAGPSYTVTTVTAARDGAALENLGKRVQESDLSSWTRDVDSLRHEVVGKVVRPLPWSPMQELDLASIPGVDAEHAQSIYMEDTVWPYEGKLDEYIERSGTLYAEQTVARRAKEGASLLEVQASFRSVYGAGIGREIILMQKVTQPELLLWLLGNEVPAEHRAPGTWMHDALELRDRWQSRLLRTATWSPLW